MKYKDYLGKESLKVLKDRFEDLLESSGGFILIANFDKNRISDSYFKVCKHDVMEMVQGNVDEADQVGLLSKCHCDKRN